MSNQSPAVELEVMVTGTVPTPHAYVFRPESGNLVTHLAKVLRRSGQTVVSPMLAYVVRHPSAGTILIDTGLHPDARENLRGDFGLAMSLVFRSMRPAEARWTDQLLRLGVEPGAVERVLMTHLHVDHTSGMRLLPDARFTLSRAEWEEATRPHADRRGFVAHHLPPEERVDLVDFDASEPYGGFSETIDWLGDGSIRLVSTPGHTSGHMSVLLRVAGGRQVLVVGDACYTLRSIREQRLPLFTIGDRTYADTLRELKAFWEQDPEAILVPSHDPDAYRALREIGAAHTFA